MHQMGLAHTDSTVYEQRVIGAGWHRRDRLRRCMRKLIAGTHYKVVEVELEVDLVRRALKDWIGCRLSRLLDSGTKFACDSPVGQVQISNGSVHSIGIL